MSLFGWLGNDPVFPLSIAGRYLRQANGKPFLLVGDTPWTPEVNLTNAQIDTYLNDRQKRGFNAILLQFIEHLFSGQSPADKNLNGDRPFSQAGDFSTASGAYWNVVDYIVKQARLRGIVCVAFPAYFGFTGTQEGWINEITADTAGHLQTYGAFLGARYSRSVIWSMLGDYVPNSTERDKQWNIITGIRSVRQTDLITGHSSRGNGAYATLSVYPEFLSNGINTLYLGSPGAADTQAAVAAAISPSMPYMTIEDKYENDSAVTLAIVRTSLYTSLLSGAVGHFSSVSQLWPFGTSTGTGDGLGADHALATFLNTTGTQQRLYGFKLFQSVSWWLGIPKIDASLVSGALGTTGTAARICPMVSSDGTWALIWKNNTSSVTVVMTAFSKGSMRLRWFDPTANTFTAIGTFANTGTQVVAHPGNNSGGDTDWVLMAD